MLFFYDPHKYKVHPAPRFSAASIRPLLQERSLRHSFSNKIHIVYLRSQCSNAVHGYCYKKGIVGFILSPWAFALRAPYVIKTDEKHYWWRKDVAWMSLKKFLTVLLDVDEKDKVAWLL